MKKGLLLSAIILWSFVAVVLIGIILFIAKGEFSISTLIKSENILADNTQNIVIEGSHQAVEIRKSDIDMIVVKQYGGTNTREDKLFSVSSSESVLRIYFKSSWNFSILNLSINEKLVVEIPENFTGDLHVKTASGSIKSEDGFTFGNVKLQSASGRIHCTGMIAAENLNVQTNSGGIKLGIMNVENYYLKSSSGGITAQSISGGGEAKTASGGIRLSLKNPKGDIKLNSSSGRIKVNLEPSLQFTFNAQTSSGGIHTNFATEKNEKGNRATASIGDNPTVNITANAKSGGINVEME